MNTTSRFIIGTLTTIGVAATCTILLVPHLIMQFVFIIFGSCLTGFSIYSITESETKDTDNFKKIREEIKEMERLQARKEADKLKEEEYKKPLQDLHNNTQKIINPSIRRIFNQIIKISTDINTYAIDKGNVSSLGSWNIVYLGEVNTLLMEYNSLVETKHQTEDITKKITMFNHISEKILEKCKKQYDILIKGDINKFEASLKLVDVISN